MWEKRFLADVGTHPRFMRAAKWNVEHGKKRIKATMEWRREFRPELIEPEDVAIEAETGKMWVPSVSAGAEWAGGVGPACVCSASSRDARTVHAPAQDQCGGEGYRASSAAPRVRSPCASVWERRHEISGSAPKTCNQLTPASSRALTRTRAPLCTCAPGTRTPRRLRVRFGI